MSQSHYAAIADLYDSFVKSDIDVPFFINEAKKANGAVLELMAGTGRLTLYLLEAGIPLTAVDYSADMLDVLRGKLREKSLAADVHQQDIRHLSLNRKFQQIIIPFQAFPELTNTLDQQQALERIREHLTDDGTFICTLHNPVMRRRSVDNQLRLAGRFPVDNGQLFVWLLQKFHTETVVEVLEFFEQYDTSGMMQRKRFSSLQFHLLEKAEFEHLLDATGFETVHLYGDYNYAPFDAETSPFMLWVLQKRL